MLGDLNLHQRVRCVRRNAAAGRQLQLGHQLLLAHAEALGGIGDGRLADLGQPADQRQQAAKTPARLAARRAARRHGHAGLDRHCGIRRPCARRRWRDGGRQRVEPRDQLVPEGVGLRDGDVVGQAEHP